MGGHGTLGQTPSGSTRGVTGPHVKCAPTVWATRLVRVKWPRVICEAQPERRRKGRKIHRLVLVPRHARISVGTSEEGAQGARAERNGPLGWGRGDSAGGVDQDAQWGMQDATVTRRAARMGESKREGGRESPRRP